MKASPTPPWWARLAMMSLDGPVFVLLARLAGGRGQHERPFDMMLIGALVWAGYVADRWLDARLEAEAPTWRHQAARRHGPFFLLAAGVLVLAAMFAGARPFVIWSGIFRWVGGGLPIGLVAIYCGRWLYFGWLVRALCVAWLMAACAGWGESWTFTDFTSVMILGFANLAAIRRAEVPTDRFMAPLPAWVALAAAVHFAFAPAVLYGATMGGALTIWVMGGGSGRWPERRRAAIDAVTFAALATALLI